MSSRESQGLYYNTIKDASTLARASEGKATLATLLQSGWKSAVSQWGREQLLAHRVVCSEPAAELPLLKQFLQDPTTADVCIANLVKDPESFDALKNSSEPQILRRHKPDSLGYVWAAFLPFVRAMAEPNTSAASAPSTPKQKRDRKAPERYGGGVPSDQVDLGSSPDYKQRPATSDSDSSFSSMGYTEGLGAPLLEDATVRLASCFIRCVLNYAQPENNPAPFLEFRDERRHYSYKLGRSQVHAVDDGGVQFFNKDFESLVQVALLEGKRTFQKIVNGEAVITDELLAQMVGEALALAWEIPSERKKKRAFSPTEFFHFRIPDAYRESYANVSLSPSDFLRVNSTHWLDIKQSKHRKTIASHLLALIAWAHQDL